MLAYVEPLAEIIRWSPGPGFVYSQQPGVISLDEFGKCLGANLVKNADVVIAVVALDGFAASVAEVHCRVPFLLHGVWPTVPFHSVEGVHAVVRLGGREMQHESANAVGILIEQYIEIGL